MENTVGGLRFYPGSDPSQKNQKTNPNPTKPHVTLKPTAGFEFALPSPLPTLRDGIEMVAVRFRCRAIVSLISDVVLNAGVETIRGLINVLIKGKVNDAAHSNLPASQM